MAQRLGGRERRLRPLRRRRQWRWQGRSDCQREKSARQLVCCAQQWQLVSSSTVRVAQRLGGRERRLRPLRRRRQWRWQGRSDRQGEESPWQLGRGTQRWIILSTASKTVFEELTPRRA